MNPLESQRAFYSERVPAQFNATIDAQERAADQDPAAKSTLEEMRAVRTSIRVEVTADAETEVHVLAIDRGRMKAVDTPERPPFFILEHHIEDFEALRRECGDSILGFLGAMAGLREEMRLTSQRVRSLRELAGSLRFEVAGSEGFSLVASFGVPEPEENPRAVIHLRPEIFKALRDGTLDAQTAFLDEKVEVEGDMEMAVGLALAALSPD